MIGLFQFVNGEAIITAEGGARRLASVYGSPNNVGLFLGRCIPFLLAFLLVRVDRRRRVFAGDRAGRSSLIAVVLSQSAGALFLGVPAAVAAVLLLIFGRRGLVALLGLAAVGAGRLRRRAAFGALRPRLRLSAKARTSSAFASGKARSK